MLCSNCEEKAASLRCKNCSAPENHFCHHCWTIHTQVKAYRLHTSTALQTNSRHHIQVIPQSPSLMSQIMTLYNNAISALDFEFISEEMGDLVEEKLRSFHQLAKDMNATFIAIGLATSLVIHFVAKLLFGKRAIYIIALAGILIVRWLRNRQGRYTKEMKALLQKSESIKQNIARVKTDELSPSEQLKEFDYMLDSGRSKFRQRGKLYKGVTQYTQPENE